MFDEADSLQFLQNIAAELLLIFLKEAEVSVIFVLFVLGLFTPALSGIFKLTTRYS